MNYKINSKSKYIDLLIHLKQITIPLQMTSQKDEMPFATSASKKVSAADINHDFQRVEKRRDPRFDAVHEFDSNAFKASYKFVQSLRETELKQLQTELKETDDESKRACIKERILKNKQKIGVSKSFQKEIDIKKKLKQKE